MNAQITTWIRVLTLAMISLIAYEVCTVWPPTSSQHMQAVDPISLLVTKGRGVEKCIKMHHCHQQSSPLAQGFVVRAHISSSIFRPFDKDPSVIGGEGRCHDYLIGISKP